MGMKSMVFRTVVTGMVILAAFLFQNNIFAAIPLIRTTPNLLLLVTVSFGLLHGRLTGLWVGFFSGLLMDVFGGTLLGQYALILSVLGYGCGFFTPYFFLDFITLPMGVCAVCEIFYGLYVYVTGFLLRGRLDIAYYFRAVILPELIYTVVVLVIVYRFLMFVNHRLEAVSKRRSADRLV